MRCGIMNRVMTRMQNMKFITVASGQLKGQRHARGELSGFVLLTPASPPIVESNVQQNLYDAMPAQLGAGTIPCSHYTHPSVLICLSVLTLSHVRQS